MFFVISKILGYLLSPYLWVIILFFIAFFQRNPRKTKRYLAFALGLFLFFSNNFIADEFMRLWEVPVQKESSLSENYDVGILLCGSIIQQDKQNDRFIFRANTDRFLQTLNLYKKGRIKKILVSGGAGLLTERNMLESSLLKQYMIGIGIPSADILIDSLSDNTHQNALNSSKILKQFFPTGKYLLITSSSHMRRAIACFENQGITCTPYPTNKITGKRLYTFQHLFIPGIHNILFYDTIIHESLGYVIYMIMGYV